MSQEFFAIIGAAVAISGLILRLGARMDTRIDGLDKRIDGLDKRINGLEGRIDGLDVRLNGLAERVARIEGMLGALLPPERVADTVPQ